MASISDENESSREKGRDWKTILRELPDYGLTVSFLGVRASGKTFLLNHVVHEMMPQRKYTAAFLFSATAFTQKGSYEWIPESHKFTSLEPLSEVLARQREVCDLNEELEKNRETKKYIRSTVCIVVDDFVNFNLRSSREVTGLYTHGRHLRHQKSGSLIDIFTLGQDIVQLAPVQRSNCDIIFTARTLSLRSTKMTVEDYLTSLSGDKKKGYDMLKNLSQHMFLFLVIFVTKQPKTTIESYTYYAKAPPKAPKFRIGSKMQWKEQEE